MAAADALSPTLRLEACGEIGRGYFEQNDDGLQLTTVNHVAELFRDKLLDGCDILMAGDTSLSLPNLMENEICDLPVNLPDNVIEKANDRLCRYDLSEVGFEKSENWTQPELRVESDITYGDIVAIQSNVSENLVVFRVEWVYPSLVLLEPIEGELCKYHSGSPLLPAVQNVNGGYEIGDYVSLGGISGFAGLGVDVPKSMNCLGADPGDSMGVLVNRS